MVFIFRNYGGAQNKKVFLELYLTVANFLQGAFEII